MFAPRSKDNSATPLDPLGALLSLVGVSALLYGIIEGPERGWTSATVLAPIAATVALLLGFARRENRAPAPLLAPATARHPGMQAGAAIVPAVFFALSVAFTMLAAQAMDPRLIWDSAERDTAHA